MKEISLHLRNQPMLYINISIIFKIFITSKLPVDHDNGNNQNPN
jgi:hypothetical protein